MPSPPASKLIDDARHALAGARNGAVILVGGFGDSGIPFTLLHALRDMELRDLTIVSINAGRGAAGIPALIDAGQVSRVICSFPRTAGSVAFERAYLAGTIALEVVPMGTLAERLRAGGAGIPAFYTRVAAGTALAAGKESRTFEGREHILEQAIRGDVALVKADRADIFGNLLYRGADRNLNPVVARAAALTIAEATQILPLGGIAPAEVTTPGVYVDHLVASKGDAPHG